MLPSLARLELPRLAEGIERARHNDDELMIRSPDPPGAAGYLRLEPADERLLELMDGTRTPGEILVENFRRGHGLPFARLGRLIEALKAGRFLVQPPVEIYAALTERLRGPQRRSLLWWLRLRPDQLLSLNVWSWRGADAFFERLYRAGGWVLFHPWFIAITTLGSLVGFALLIAEFLGDRYELFQTFDSYILGLITLAAIDVFCIATHDGAHGLAMRHVNRKIIRAGVMLYYFSPIVYVDSTDVWMLPRRRRIIVAWAGPFSGLLIGGLAGVVAAFPPSDFVGEVAFKLATISFMTSIFNLIPLLELDGYYILVDLLDAPLLRSRSFHTLFKEVPSRLRRGLEGMRTLTREERFLAFFGVASLVFSVGIAVSGAALLGRRVTRMVDALWSDDVFSKALVVLLVAGLALPLVLTLYSAGRAVAERPVVAAVGAVRRRLPGSIAGMLQRVSLFRDMSIADIETIAAHASRRRLPAGAVIVREGEPGDEFFIIAGGSAEARVEGRDRPTQLAPGDFFGEVALLERVPRTASVVAVSPLDLVVLDAGHFRRWLGEHPNVRARIVERLQEWDRLAHLPLLAGVAHADLDILMRELESVRYAAGDVIVAEGDTGDALYIIADGEVEVTQGGRAVRRLGAGDYFGEVALLGETPRTATVTARGAVRAYRLPRAGFERLLQTAGQRAILAGMERYPDLRVAPG